MNEDSFKTNLDSIDPYISRWVHEGRWISDFQAPSSLIKKFKIILKTGYYIGDVIVVFQRSNKEYIYPNVPGEYICGLIRAYAKGESVGKYFNEHIKRYSIKPTS